jgi:hypothetical protein
MQLARSAPRRVKAAEIHNSSTPAPTLRVDGYRHGRVLAQIVAAPMIAITTIRGIEWCTCPPSLNVSLQCPAPVAEATAARASRTRRRCAQRHRSRRLVAAHAEIHRRARTVPLLLSVIALILTTPPTSWSPPAIPAAALVPVVVPYLEFPCAANVTSQRHIAHRLNLARGRRIHRRGVDIARTRTRVQLRAASTPSRSKSQPESPT